MYRYAKLYEVQGLDGFLRDNYVAYGGQLNAAQEEAIRREVSSCLYLSSQEICHWVELNLGVKYSAKGMVKVLHRLGFV